MKQGIDVKFVTTKYEKGSSGKLHMKIDAMFANYYSDVIGEKVRDTFVDLREEGRRTGPAPIGYLDEGSDNKPIDPVRGPIVKRIFELYATGEWSFVNLTK